MSKRVIIADDSELIVNQLVSFFEKELSFEVVGIAYDGEDALELYRKHTPDLITLDITMPNMDGQETIDELIKEFPDANILMISAVSGDAMLECMSAGAKNFVEKPLKLKNEDFAVEFKKTILDIVGA